MRTKVLALCALALVGFWACKREEAPAPAPVNPTYDPAKNTVNTQFVLAISPGTGSPDTKQTAVDVQASGANFRGIVDAHLLTYSLSYTGVGGANYLYDVSDASSVAVRDYDLGTLATPSDVNEDENRRILELALPLGTNNILLVGRAPTTGTANEQGSVNYSGVALGSTLENVSFKLNPRLSDKDAFLQFGDLMGHILTYMMRADLVNQTSELGYKIIKDNSYKFWWPIDATSEAFDIDDAADAHPGYTKYTGTKTWKQYGDQYASNPTSMKPLEEILGEAYNQVMYLRSDGGTKIELRAGAAVTIVRLVSDMYNIISRVIAATPTTPEEHIAKLLAQEAYSRSALFFHYDQVSSKLNFRTKGDIMDGIDLVMKDRTASYYNKVTDAFFYYSKTSSTDTRTEYVGFPMNMDMPTGSAIMTFTEKNAGSEPNYIEVGYAQEIPTYGMGSTSGFPIENYRYPAELTYYANSPIRTSDTAVEKSSYPVVAANWTNSSYWNTSIWTGSEVKSSTRSVAVTKTVNYGTALLKSQFAFKDSEIEDNNKGIHPNETNNKVAVNVANKFLVTGIIIGGVNDEVGWNFLPKGSNYNKFVYDNLNNTSFAIPPYTTDPDSKWSAPVYTCTWDNYNPALAADAQAKVYIGLELINNSGEDLWAELNLIRNGGTFYLVGELDPSAAGVTDNLKKNGVIDLSRSDCYYPPFDDTGKTINAPRVFMQDYVTSVKFNFAKDALKHAYVTMPDLRSGQVSLGLSVDLTWEKGMEFEVDMGKTTD